MLKALSVATLITGMAALSAGAAEPQTKPTQPEPKEYLVFFPAESATVTPQADEVLGFAARDAAVARSIEVFGTTDTAEKEPRSLSLRRANAVGESLYRHGIPDSVRVIETGLGATGLLVPTGPNSKQPQNRRVVIRILYGSFG